MTTKKTSKRTASTPGEAPARKKLTLKKDTLKDLAPTSDRSPKGGGRSITCRVDGRVAGVLGTC